MSGPGSRTRVIALLGDPVGHSLSPLMQNAAFRAAGLDAVYVALPCVAEDLPGVMRTLVRQGGGGNVTIPHKARAAEVGSPDPRVARAGVANVFGGGPEGVHVGNTDVDGIRATVDRLGAGLSRWIVLGTGGSARAVGLAAAEHGAALAVRSRSAERGAAFEAWLRTLGVEVIDPTDAELLLNATPVGLAADDPIPGDVGTLPALRAVIDLTYRQVGRTPLVEWATGRGLLASDGREMLLIQGAAAWHWWFPGVTPPTEVMRAALEGRLG
ncbi:MAG: shikimate dehydrogenase [Gemmatimonadetes bacterium]|nr:shikimate dehydrogenase [Gemmatimonadota bacterium]MCA9761498.1 shikimate dehydrogenase [Gemmatimonadota bacterium]MCB9517545.1 shikimate dehydrogenase [Gemmatimonadales bacterium]HRX18117.1 hypothetical protein [Gemmatimonadales bacterium]